MKTRLLLIFSLALLLTGSGADQCTDVLLGGITPGEEEGQTENQQ